ncbi:unnamed protein product [Danaus chrysippus]|uniref:(African queen) hypothetical protein n=1 Tax=Danaus chrysippus TaxID=151541 RepID=A0A8J2W5F0_9NEOP|nr:unnamed protein product [Danaus chrysippus]
MLSESLKDARKSERQITVCWIDLENAFGSIQHELMLFALRWYNFPPLVSDMIASYYSKLKFSIITKEGPSKIDKLISNEKKWGYRFKFNNKYTESILAFADDLAILTRHPKHCQVLLDEVDKFCEWTDGLRTKPNAGVIKMLKLWLGLALTADSSALFRDRNSFGMNLKKTIGALQTPKTLKWRTLIHDWSPALLKFYLNAFQMTLPDQSNLVRWGKGTEKTCYICGKAVGTAKHLLVGCKVLLDSGQYSRRHDRLLEIILFVREGTRAIKSNVKPYSILKAASDWTIMMDTYEKQYKIPEDICASASRPDIFLYSRILKRVVMIELTVPWETNIPKDYAIKVNKYYELTNELTRNRFVVDLYAVEVGARGITAKSLYNLLKDLGLSRTNINSFLERTSKAALVGSFQIWLGRERNLDSGGERITRVS